MPSSHAIPPLYFRLVSLILLIVKNWLWRWGRVRRFLPCLSFDLHPYFEDLGVDKQHDVRGQTCGAPASHQQPNLAGSVFQGLFVHAHWPPQLPSSKEDAHRLPVGWRNIKEFHPYFLQPLRRLRVPNRRTNIRMEVAIW
jgi:hypothetical protein